MSSFSDSRNSKSRANFQGTDVDDFNPDRFIGEDGQLLPAASDTKDGTTTLHLIYDMAWSWRLTTYNATEG